MRPTAGGLRPSECGFASPPADGTPYREVVDRFADFLRAAGRPPLWAQESASVRYRARFLAWRFEAFDATAEEQILPWW